MQQMPESREDSVYLAKLAEQAERYEGTVHSLLLTCHQLIVHYRDG